MTAAGAPPVRMRLLFCLATLANIGAAGCNARPSATPSAVATVRQADPYEELVQSVRDELRQSTDQAACRRVVDQLNVYLPRLPADRRPAAPTDAEREKIRVELGGLQSTALAEVTRAEFTTVDVYYLEETFLFRDIARALDVDRLPPLARAEAALAWVVRTLRTVAPSGPPAPPWFVAMRGSATPVERLFVFQALVRQLDLDAVFVLDEAGGPEGTWAAGVPLDGQLHLFDVRAGLPLPAPGGGVLTLAEARSAAEPFKPLALDSNLPYDVTGERARRAGVLVMAPLSAFSPRMRFLQSLLSEGTARLEAFPPANAERVRKAVAAKDVGPVHFGCLPLLFNFLPTSEGGGDDGQPGQRPREQYFLRQVPFGLLPPFLQQLPGEPGNRVRLEFIDRALTLMQPGQAREQVLRGRYREATDKLVALQEWTKRPRGSTEELEKTTRGWAEAARAYYAEQSRQGRGQGDPAGALRMEELKATMEELQRHIRGPHAYIDHVVSDELAAQATYLLALCKQEEAERLHGPEAPAAKAAWASARRWWTSFLDKYPNRPESAAARRNLARCLAATGKVEEAKAAYELLTASDLPPLERLACRYLAVSLK